MANHCLHIGITYTRVKDKLRQGGQGVRVKEYKVKEFCPLCSIGEPKQIAH